MGKIYWNSLDIELQTDLKKAVNNTLIPDGTTITKNAEGIISAKMSDISGVVKTVNSVPPDEQGNVNTDYQIVDPIPPSLNPSDYPAGTSEFMASVSDDEPTGWNAILRPESIPNPELSPVKEPETYRIFVRTNADKMNHIYLQEIDDNENGFFEASFYRFSNDGVSWSPAMKVKRVKTINGIEPDDNNNVTIPAMSPDWGEF
mgnify:CR=1 FL=1